MDSVVPWRRGCYGLICLVLVQFLFLNNRGVQQTSISIPELFANRMVPMGLAPGAVRLVETSLGNITGDGLTTEQCRTVFPDLHYPVDQSVAYWKQKGHIIGEEDLDQTWRAGLTNTSNSSGAMRILIQDNELRILESVEPTIGNPGYHGRAVGALFNIQNALQSAIAGGEKLPTIEAALAFQDIVTYPDPDGTQSWWTWAAHMSDETHRRHWLMPDYDFRYGWPMGPYYTDARRRAMEHDAPFIRKIPKAVWRGTTFFGYDVRAPLVDISRDKEWADITTVNMGDQDDSAYIEIDEICKYAFAVHTEGVSFSGRLKFILNCNSLPIVHELNWMTDWYHLLKAEGPDQNYVRVRRDWTDLEEKIKYYLNHPDEAQRVIDNHVATFRERYLTKAAQSCYIRALIQGYSTVSYKPEVYRRYDSGKSKIRRGQSFEAWIDSPRDFAENSLTRNDP